MRCAVGHVLNSSVWMPSSRCSPSTAALKSRPARRNDPGTRIAMMQSLNRRAGSCDPFGPNAATGRNRRSPGAVFSAGARLAEADASVSTALRPAAQSGGGRWCSPGRRRSSGRIARLTLTDSVANATLFAENRRPELSPRKSTPQSSSTSELDRDCQVDGGMPDELSSKRTGAASSGKEDNAEPRAATVRTRRHRDHDRLPEAGRALPGGRIARLGATPEFHQSVL